VTGPGARPLCPNVVTQFSNLLIFPAMTGVSVTFRHGRFHPISCDLVVALDEQLGSAIAINTWM
jgi:hypothetical protein